MYPPTKTKKKSPGYSWDVDVLSNFNSEAGKNFILVTVCYLRRSSCMSPHPVSP